MKRFAVLTFGLAALAAATACGQPAGTLAAAAEALKANDTKSIEYSGTGKWFQFGQAPSAMLHQRITSIWCTNEPGVTAYNSAAGR